MPARIPFLIVCGFLGSGKTSLINAWLAGRRAERALVLVNELGQAAVDHRLIEGATGQTAVPLPGGCLCCAWRGKLAERLNQALALAEPGLPFERIVIETSGVASPAGIERELMRDPDLGARLRAAGVVACLDANEVGSGRADRPEARTQIALADRIVVTKTDLWPEHLSAAQAFARTLNPDAPIVVRPDPGPRLDAVFEGGPRPSNPRWAGVQTGSQHSAFERLSVTPPLGTGRDAFLRLAELCERGGDAMLRLKGFLRGDDGSLVAVQAVAGLLYPPVSMPADMEQAAILTIIGEAGMSDRLAPVLEGWLRAAT